MDMTMKEIRLPIWLLVIVASALLAATFHNRPATKGMIRVEGTTHGEPATTINPFLLDKNLVTVAEFELFVKETGYITQAERYGDAGVFDRSLIYLWMLSALLSLWLFISSSYSYSAFFYPRSSERTTKRTLLYHLLLRAITLNWPLP